MSYDPSTFAEKYQLAFEAALDSKPESGLCGFELEWNLLDEQFRPLLTVGSGPSKQSFVDYFRTKTLPPWLRGHSQLEVFHWMIEWVTRPYYHPRGAVYEGRLLEGSLLNGLSKAGREHSESLYSWHGNLLSSPRVGPESIPNSWHLAKRRYLERCVDLFGNDLATAGIHTNLSLPEPLLAWDFMHLTPSERGEMHLDEYKSNFYITATRLLRAFAALFVATTASTPFKAVEKNGQYAVELTAFDSVRNLVFPNPAHLDLPDLYRSYEDYLRISYDVVRRGIRFGNNNWTPVRARSFAEPVERLIEITSAELNELYARGLYAAGETGQVEEMAHQVEIQNLLARINLPMARVEVRTDDGCQTLETDIANLTLKHLLLLRIYADPDFARAFRYDREDIDRARRNEEQAARAGLRAEIENPFTAKKVGMRAFLRWTLDEVRPLAEALGLWEDLAPLEEMAAGEGNAAEKLRARVQAELGAAKEVPVDLLAQLAKERREQVIRDVEFIAENYSELGTEAGKVSEFLIQVRDDVRADPQAPVRFRPRPEALLQVTNPDTTSEIISLASQLIRLPSVTASPEEKLDAVHRAGTFVFDYLRNNGLEVQFFNQSKYPALLAGFPGQIYAPVMLSGHFDVVAPEPDARQFEPYIEGDYLWGRGSADMKTVVATYLVWLRDMLRQGPPYPPVNLMLIGNEENGEGEPMGTPHVLKLFSQQEERNGSRAQSYAPEIFIAGERTGERGDELYGEICTENRGVMRFDVIARGQRGHTGVAAAKAELTDRLIEARAAIAQVLSHRLTLSSPDGWQSSMRFPFIQVGTPGVYNINADYGVLGVEVRPIPQDDVDAVASELEALCSERGLELKVSVMENGIQCSPANPYLGALIAAVREESGTEPRLGRKLPGTSARFAPNGQGVVWGQTGIGPHSKDERHYIPSILPYYNALTNFARKAAQQRAGITQSRP